MINLTVPEGTEVLSSAAAECAAAQPRLNITTQAPAFVGDCQVVSPRVREHFANGYDPYNSYDAWSDAALDIYEDEQREISAVSDEEFQTARKISEDVPICGRTVEGMPCQNPIGHEGECDWVPY